MGILEQVGIGLITIFLGVLAGIAWERAKFLERYGHIRSLLRGYNRVQIIVSNVEISRFRFPGLESGDAIQLNVPRNVLYMPMPEGRAIAELAGIIRQVNPKIQVQLVTANSHDPDVLTFSVGGPSVNLFSAKTLRSDFPQFSIDYPAAKRAKYEGHIFETSRDPDNRIVRDYGFVFVTHTSKHAPCIVLCGVRAFGTAMAVELFRELPARSEPARLIRNARKAFMAADGRVEGLAEADVRLCFCREIPRDGHRVI
jgi:hypothetical protein